MGYIYILTDPILFNELIRKRSQGVTIEIILDENKSNREAPFALAEYFPTHWISLESYYKNICMKNFVLLI